MALGGEPDLDLAVRGVSFSPDAVDAGQTIDVHRRPLGAGASGAGPRLLGGGS